MSAANRIWLPVFVGVVFAAGVATGVLFSEYLQSAPAALEQRPPSPLPTQLTEMLSAELQLTATQRVRLEGIVDARRRNFAEVRAGMRLRFERDVNDLVTEVRDILTPVQREK